MFISVHPYFKNSIKAHFLQYSINKLLFKVPRRSLPVNFFFFKKKRGYLCSMAQRKATQELLQPDDPSLRGSIWPHHLFTSPVLGGKCCSHRVTSKILKPAPELL